MLTLKLKNVGIGDLIMKLLSLNCLVMLLLYHHVILLHFVDTEHVFVVELVLNRLNLSS